MAILYKTERDNSHWYTRDGNPQHFTPGRNGKERPVWITDARRLGLLPSVTNILGIIAKPQLENWKLKQVAIAALRNPRGQDEPEDYYIDRLVEMSKMGVKDAADLGTRVHAALDAALAGNPYPDDLAPYVRPVVEWRNQTEIEITEREIVVTNNAEGYAGRVDVLFSYGKSGIGILDYKTRKTKPGEPCQAYDGQAAQLAAYAAAYYGAERLQRVLMANIFISSTEPGRMDVVKHDDPERHYAYFLAAAAVWRYAKDYDPRKATGNE